MGNIKLKILKDMDESINNYSSGYDIIELLETKELYENYNYDEVDSGVSGESRWSVHKYVVTEVSTKDGEHVMFIKSAWDAPATEMQEGQETNLELWEVFKKEVTTTIYV